jgi:hypothetical protein
MKLVNNIAIIDSDLIDGGTNFPNLALMKISSYYKNIMGCTTKLLLDYNDLHKYDKVFISKVFSKTKVPEIALKSTNVEIGGTGFFGEHAKPLDFEIEHSMPDYHLYDEYVKTRIASGEKRKKFSKYLDFSIGFTTRGCFRKCEFCVNKKYDRVERHAKVSEFLDKTRRYISLWDDNILGFSGWREIFKELEDTKKRFHFKQGLDIRLLTEEKAEVLSKVKYHKDFIFAFDDIKDREVIERNLAIWRSYCKKSTKLYVLCGFKSVGVDDIVDIFERISIIIKYKCLPYIMRHENYILSEYKNMYITIARWCNQPSLFKKKSFREFCIADGENGVAFKKMREFADKFPDIALKYFDLKFGENK